ncbi:MAG: Uma2 family endonuclease [Gemmatimonadetes bacterium]|nr:MAG: Uma2 family endonuclease [Gemmatimonadota bacterium]PYP95095.1 MAG: Uma2 family endonuclease [Gemmatimonadota bacterium]
MPAERAYVPNVPATLMTAEELLAANVTDKRTELVRGVLVVREPAGGRHGRAVMKLAIRLGVHVEREGAGHLFAAETGFTLARGPDTVRAPDIAFVRRERLPSSVPVGFPELAPDLVVEVLSPDDRPGETLAKVGDWLEAGARLVWVIDPQGRNARVYRADGSQTSVSEADHLEGEDVLPGFRCELASIF